MCTFFFIADYANMPFPSVMSIVDYLRCSVTFDSCKEMIDGLNDFIDKVKNKRAGCVIDIVRCKNMFANINDWVNKKIIKSEESDGNENDTVTTATKTNYEIETSKVGYCDIKFNVIIFHNGLAMCGEIQFLLSWMLKASLVKSKAAFFIILFYSFFCLFGWLVLI